MKTFSASVLLLAALVSAEPPSNTYLPSGRFLFLPARLQSQEPVSPLPGYIPSETAGPTTPVAAPRSNQTAGSTTPVAAEEEVVPSSDKESEQLNNADSGVYYVLLPDGRLQRVEYTTAALVKEEPSGKLVGQDSKQAGETERSQSKASEEANSKSNDEAATNSEIPYKFQSSPTYYQTGFQQQAYFQPRVNPGVHYIQTQDGIQQQAFSRVQVEQPQIVAPYQTSYNVNGVQYQIIQNQPAHYVEIQAEQAAEQREKEEDVPEEKEDQPDSPTVSVNGFKATVQYTDVEPISAPIYAYNAAPLVRILKK